MIKSYEFTLKDVDTKQGIIEGYFSVFHNTDSDGDVMLPGAFNKSIAEAGPQSQKPRIKHLLDHDTTKRVGFIQELKEDEHGLYFRSKLTKATVGRDALIQYEEGILTDHSVGMQIIQSDRNEDTGIRGLKEVRLWEGSTVTWGANALAGVTNVKGSMEDHTKKLKAKIDHWAKVLYKGELSDDACFLLQIQLEQIKEYLETLEPSKNTQAVDDDELIAIFRNKLSLT